MLTTEELKQAELLVRILESNLLINDTMFYDAIKLELVNLLVSETTKASLHESIVDSPKTIKFQDNNSNQILNNLDDTKPYTEFLATYINGEERKLFYPEAVTEQELYNKYTFKSIKGIR